MSRPLLPCPMIAARITAISLSHPTSCLQFPLARLHFLLSQQGMRRGFAERLGCDPLERLEYRMTVLSGKERVTLVAALLLTALSGILSHAKANEVLVFVLSGATPALLASLVGQATEHLGTRLSPGATGV